MISRYFTKRPVFKPHKITKRDPQRYPLYFIERLLGGGYHLHETSNKHLKDVANYVCRLYNVTPPVVVTIRDKANPRCGWCEDAKIFLNRDNDGATVMTLLHELAHYIVFSVYDEHEVEDHGAEFVAVYGWLLDRFNLLPRMCWDDLCEDYEIIQAHDGSPETVRYEKATYLEATTTASLPRVGSSSGTNARRLPR